MKPFIPALNFFLWLAGVLLCVSPAAAAVANSSDWFHRAWETEDGLPDNDVVGVGQSRDGYLWVGTKGGILQFNGAQFNEIPVIELPGVPSRSVRAMVVDNLGQLWLAMERGPVLCIGKDSIRSFGVEAGLLRQRVTDLAVDHEGGVWVAYPAQLRRIFNGVVEKIGLSPEMEGVAPSAFATDAAGHLWLARGPHLAVWREQQLQAVATLPFADAVLARRAGRGLWICGGGQLYRFSETEQLVAVAPLPMRVQPTCMLEDEAGVLWVGTLTEGLLCWRDERWEKVTTSHPEISSLTSDAEGNLWAGTTGGGLNLIRMRVVELLGRARGLPVESLRSVSEERNGALWLVSQNGDVVRGEHGTWAMVELAADGSVDRANCIIANPSGGMWLGSGSSGLWRFQNERWEKLGRLAGMPSGNIRSLLVANNGDLWIASASPESLVRFRAGRITPVASPGPVAAIRAMAETADGTIWVGTSDGELLRVEGDALVRETSLRERVTLSIRALHATPDGSLWIGYAGDGLGRLKDGKHARLTRQEGLVDDYISQVLADGNGFLWILGNRGLSRVSQSQLEAVLEGKMERVQARFYGRNDGVPTLQPSRDYSPACWRTADGRLCFTTRNGLLVVRPDKVQHNHNVPPVVIESVQLDDEPLAEYGVHSILKLRAGKRPLKLTPETAPLSLPARHRKIEIQFAGLSFASPENVQFRYRLKGFDQKWVEAGAMHRAIYPQLPAGEYEFRVLAANSAGVWNESGAALTLQVPPFFWETWWFKGLGAFATVLVAGGVMYWYARRRYNRKLQRLEARRALEQERSRIARDIHDDLGASLTEITLLSQTGASSLDDPQGALGSLRQIHTTACDLTQAMGEVVWAVNPEHDSLDGLVNYLSGYATSFLTVAGVRCRLELPLSLPPHVLSAEVRHNLYLAFKEALNNVVKHAHATEVHISLQLEPAGFRLRVTDNGRGLDCPPTSGLSGRGNGLKNLRARITEIGGSCEIQPAAPRGTQVTFIVPLRERLVD